MRIKASTNTSISTSTTSINLATVDFSRGSGLTASSTAITIGSGISLVRVSAVIIAESGADTYIFSRLRRNRGGTLVEFTSQLNRFTVGYASSSHPSYLLSVQPGDIIDIRADVGSGTATISATRPQWLQVEVAG